MDPNSIDYLKGGKQSTTTHSSLLISSSKYLNHAGLRDVLAQEMLRRYSDDLPPAYLVSNIMQALNELTDIPKFIDLFQRERALKPEFAAWLDERFSSDIKAEELIDYPPGTLGNEIHEFITSSGMVLEFIKFDAGNDLEYFQKRFVQGHDIQHMVTGFGTDVVGETALNMLSTESYLRFFEPEFCGEISRLSMLLNGAGLLRCTLHYPAVLSAFIDAFARGVEMGRKLKRPLFFEKWENYYSWKIDDIREELNIVGAIKKGEWDWVHDAMKG